MQLSLAPCVRRSTGISSLVLKRVRAAIDAKTAGDVLVLGTRKGNAFSKLAEGLLEFTDAGFSPSRLIGIDDPQPALGSHSTSWQESIAVLNFVDFHQGSVDEIFALLPAEQRFAVVFVNSDCPDTAIQYSRVVLNRVSRAGCVVFRHSVFSHVQEKMDGDIHDTAFRFMVDKRNRGGVLEILPM